MFHLKRRLMDLGPFPDTLKILTLMNSIEIRKGLRFRFVPPYLAENTRVYLAHKLLANNVKAVRHVRSQYIVLVFERSFTEGVIVVIVVVRTFPKEIKTV